MPKPDIDLDFLESEYDRNYRRDVYVSKRTIGGCKENITPDFLNDFGTDPLKAALREGVFHHASA